MFSRTRLSGGWTRETSCIVKMNSGMPSRPTTDCAQQKPFAQAARGDPHRGRTELLGNQGEHQGSEPEAPRARRLDPEPDQAARLRAREALGETVERPRRDGRARLGAEQPAERARRAAAQEPGARRELAHGRADRRGRLHDVLGHTHKAIVVERTVHVEAACQAQKAEGEAVREATVLAVADGNLGRAPAEVDDPDAPGELAAAKARTGVHEAPLVLAAEDLDVD